MEPSPSNVTTTTSSITHSLRRFFWPARLSGLRVPPGAEPGLIQIYEQLLTGLLRAGVLLAGIVIVLAAQGMIRQGRVAQLVIILFLVGLVALVSVRRQIDYGLRCGLWLLSLYSVGVVELIYLGFASTTQLYLAGFTLCTAILLNYNPRLGLAALALSVATLVLANALAFGGYFVPIAGPPLPTTLPQIIVRGLLFLLVVGTCQAGIGILLHHLRASLRREHLAREELELRVAERTSELAAAHAQALGYGQREAAQNAYLAALHQTTLDLLNERDVDALLSAIIERASTILRIPWVFIVLEEQGELILKTFSSNYPLTVGIRVPATARITWQCFTSRQPVVIEDYLTIEGRLPIYNAIDPGAVADIPILAGARCLGVLGMMRSRQQLPFSADEVEQAMTFARLVALVLDNAHLYATAQRELAERERAEADLRHYADELAAAHTQALAHSQHEAQQSAYLAALHQTTLDLLNERDVDALLQAIVDRAAAIVQVQHVLLMLEADGELVVKTFTPGQGVYVGQRSRREVALVSWRAFESRQPVVIEDYLTLETRMRIYDPLHLRALADIPIIIGARCLGVLSLGRDQPGQPFTPAEIDQALTFARLAAVVIHNAQLYDTAQRELVARERAEAALQRHADELATAHALALAYGQREAQQSAYLAALHQTTLDLLSHREQIDLLDLIVARAASILDASAAIVVLERDGELITMALTPDLPTYPGSRAERGVAILTWQCYETRQPVVVDHYIDRADRNKALDTLGIQSIAHIPILAGERCLGVLALDRTQRNHPFTQSEVERASTLAQLAAVVIDNARLYDAALREADERRRAEAALQRHAGQLESQNSELDAFAHTVAHDLKNPLTGLIGYSELLQNNYALFDKTQVVGFLNDITRMGYKMTHIINELLFFANIRAQADVPVSTLAMDSILLDVELRLQTQLQSSHATLVQPECWPVALGYAPWIEEVWMNYISNAIKYGGSPPSVTLGAAAQADGQIRFWVDDNGGGLTPEDRARLFAPFTRLRGDLADGHGLGLSIVQRIITRLGGVVGVEDAPGQGCRFFFTLPAAPAG